MHVDPFRTPEPRRSELVAQYGDDLVTRVEGEITADHQRLIYGDPDAKPPLGLLHASALTVRR